jgi:membrane protease YdiL (CAAX protease family)
MAPKFLRIYWKETRRPIYAAALIAPFFLIYHVGIFFLQTTYVNGADALIIRLLRPLSVNAMFASALVLLCCFLYWQIRSKGSWTVDVPKLLALYLESLLLAILLLLSFSWLAAHFPLAASNRESGLGRLSMLALYCGAGIYEELVFRGMLLGGMLLIFRKIFGWKGAAAAVTATLLAAVAFSLFHYMGPSGDRFALNSFLQRAFAGVYFSAIFVTRGFGVAAASHALYDILVGLILP